MPQFLVVFFLSPFSNLVSKYESGRTVIPTLPEDSKEMAHLLMEHARPLVGEMTKENQLALFGERPLLVAYFDVDWDKQLRKGATKAGNMIDPPIKDPLKKRQLLYNE